MIEEPTFMSDPSARAARMRAGGVAPRPRMLFWTIVLSILASLGLWALIAMSVSALLRALTAQ